MNRRKFFSLLPIAPVGAVMATAAAAKAPCESLAPDKALMTLNAHKPPPPTTKYPKWNMSVLNKPGSVLTTQGWVDSGFHSNVVFGKGLEIKADHNFDEETKVSMAVGKDGHLWLKIGDTWKRVVTE